MQFRVNVTDGCNLRCDYCFEQKYRYTPSDVREHLPAIFDFIRRVRPAFDPSLDSFAIWGGEPLTKMDTVLELLRHASEYIDMETLKLPVLTLFTNGIVDPTPLAPYRKLVKLVMSYDGLTNTLRNRVHGDVTKVRTILQNMQRCEDAAIPFALKATMTEECFDQLHRSYAEVFYLAQKFRHCINGNEIKMEIDYRRNVPFIQERADVLRTQLLLVKQHAAMYGSRLNILKTYDDRKKCLTGPNSYVFDTDGIVYPCYQCMYVPNKSDYALGFVSDSMDKILERYEWFVAEAAAFNGGCSNCHACDATYCSRCFLVLKDLEGWQDQSACHYNRIITEAALS